MTKATLLYLRLEIDFFIKILGHGGFGETFLAEDTYLPSRRPCVIKQLKVMNDPQKNRAGQQKFQQERFGREAATLEKLGEGSSQIPKLFAYFAENEQFYLIQEWIQGPTLTDVVTAQETMSEPDVKNILVSLLSVLDYVHSGGIIHRDIKPVEQLSLSALIVLASSCAKRDIYIITRDYGWHLT